MEGVGVGEDNSESVRMGWIMILMISLTRMIQIAPTLTGKIPPTIRSALNAPAKLEKPPTIPLLPPSSRRVFRAILLTSGGHVVSIIELVASTPFLLPIHPPSTTSPASRPTCSASPNLRSAVVLFSAWQAPPRIPVGPVAVSHLKEAAAVSLRILARECAAPEQPARHDDRPVRQCLAPPLPKVVSVISSPPNLRRIGLIQWQHAGMSAVFPAFAVISLMALGRNSSSP